jgi:Zn ribbon nucleic-acid-binding protein
MTICVIALRCHFLPTYIILLIELLVNINKPRSITFTVPIYNVGKFIGFFNLCSNNMDKSWMTKPRISKEYIDGCRSFVDFAVLNCRTPEDVGGNMRYKHAGPSTEDVGGNMQAMLRDLFGVHDVREDSNETQLRAEGGEEHVSDDTPYRGDAQKYDDLLKNSDKPLHGKTRHSKLSATVHLYNLKCLGGVTNMIFSALLEFVNQLLPDDGEPLPENTYQAKKFLKDMGLGYEKIPACRNDCMLFWKDNKELESCLKCGQSKWKDEVQLNDYREIIPASKKRLAKVLRWFPLIPRLQRLFMS